MLAYHLTSVPLTFIHIDGLEISTDKSTLFSELEVRIIKNAHRNVDVCIIDEMFLLQFHVDLPSTFGGQANVTLSRLVSHANYVDFARATFRYSSINGITRDHGLV